MFFIRLDLPLPDPPRITMISPLWTSNEALSSRIRAPYPMRRLRTLMTDDASPAPVAALPECASICIILPASAREHGEDAVDHHDQNDARHDRARRREADRRRTRAGGEPALAADCRNRQAEDGGLDDAEDEVLRRDRLEELVVELSETD